MPQSPIIKLTALTGSIWARSGLLLFLATVLFHQMVAAAEETLQQATYLVQPGDILLVSVWKEPDLNTEVVVRPDGKFSFPLIGEIEAQHKSVAQLRAEIRGQISKYVPDADVMVSLLQLHGNKVYVLGKVNRPGEFPMNRPMDVMQALSLAGGMTQFADADDIIILRREKDQQRIFSFDYGKVERGKNLQQNIVLNSGDVVVVP